jgi:hypothetical protein
VAHSSGADERAIGNRFSESSVLRERRSHFRSAKTHLDNIMTEVVKYLRDIAQICTRLARACPDLPTSHGLEEVAIDLMTKAQELEQLYLK